MNVCLNVFNIYTIQCSSVACTHTCHINCTMLRIEINTVAVLAAVAEANLSSQLKSKMKWTHVLSGDLSHCLCTSVLLRENCRATKLSRVGVLSAHWTLSLFLFFSLFLSSILLIIDPRRKWMNEWMMEAKADIKWHKMYIRSEFQSDDGTISLFSDKIERALSWRLRRVLLVLANRRKFKFSHLHCSQIHHWNVLTDPLPHRQRIKTFQRTWCINLKVG